MQKIGINRLMIIPRKAVLLLVRVYQKTLSPDHGFFAYKHPYGYCKHFPTCSEYTYQAINRYGVVRGGLKSAKRVLKCNPFSQGGYDPIDLNK